MTTSSNATKRSLRAWNRAAEHYDEKIASVDAGLMKGGREWLGVRARGRILEVAIGTGRNLPFYPEHLDVTGVDLSPAMLEIARMRATELNRQVDLRVADAEALPFGDSAFDTVVCALSLCAIPSPAAAIAEMYRVLVPDGRLLLLDHVGSTWPPIFAGQWLIEQVTIRTSGEHLTRRSVPLVLSAGFEIVEAERLKAGIAERVHGRKPAR